MMIIMLKMMIMMMRMMMVMTIMELLDDDENKTSEMDEAPWCYGWGWASMGLKMVIWGLYDKDDMCEDQENK